MTIAYEHALTEHTRLLIKLEALYSEIEELLEKKQKYFAAKSLFLLIELSDLTGSQDLKFDLMRHLNKSDKSLRSLIKNPGVNDELLATTLIKIDRYKKNIRSLETSPWENFLNDHFVQSVRCKYNIRGTLHAFEIPQLNFWVHQSELFQFERIQYWLEAFMPIARTVKLILKIARDSATLSQCSASGGIYEHHDEHHPVVDLIRVLIDSNLEVFPEITGNKHKFLVRFLRGTTIREKPLQTIDSIDFKLGLVAL